MTPPKADLQALDEIIGPDELIEGSISGMLERVNLHNTTRFYIFPAIGPKQVGCDFRASLRRDVVTALDQHVLVTGKLRYKRLDKFPYAINAETIQVLPPESELPTLFDIERIAPDLTQGKNSIDFLEEMRNAEGW